MRLPLSRFITVYRPVACGLGAGRRGRWPEQERRWGVWVVELVGVKASMAQAEINQVTCGAACRLCGCGQLHAIVLQLFCTPNPPLLQTQSRLYALEWATCPYGAALT